jgi:hypothetical protein
LSLTGRTSSDTNKSTLIWTPVPSAKYYAVSFNSPSTGYSGLYTIGTTCQIEGLKNYESVVITVTGLARNKKGPTATKTFTPA